MVNIYVALIHKGLRTIDEVHPDSLKEKVRAAYKEKYGEEL